MKKLSYLFTIGILACLFCACNSKEVPSYEEIGETAKLSVKFSGTKSIESRAKTPIGEEATINNATVFVFKGEMLEAKVAFANGATEAKDIVITTGAKNIVVIANLDVSAVTSLTTYKTTIAALKNQNDANGFTMVTPLIPYTITSGSNSLGYTDADKVELTRLVARVELKSLKTDLNDYVDGKYSLTEFSVFMANALETSQIQGDDFGFGKYLFGCKALTSQLTTSTFAPSLLSIYDQAFLLNEAVAPAADGKLPDPCLFYAFENKPPAGFQTRMIIKAKVQYNDADLTDEKLAKLVAAKNVDADGFTYFSIIINKNRPSSKDEGANGKLVERNNIYNLEVLLTQLGANIPDAPDSEFATLDVKIEVAPWNVVINQKVVW